MIEEISEFAANSERFVEFSLNSEEFAELMKVEFDDDEEPGGHYGRHEEFKEGRPGTNFALAVLIN